MTTDHGRPPESACRACPASAATRPRPARTSSHALGLTRSSSRPPGLTWVHVERPDAESAAGARRPLRLAPARRRGHPLEAPAAEDRRVPGGALPLRRPPLPRLRQGDPAPERGRARHRPRARLPRHAAERRAAAGDAAVPPLRRGRGVPRAAVRQGLRPAALRGARRPLRLLLPDPRQDRPQARPGRGRDVRGPRRGRRPRHLERQAGDHLATARSSSRSARRCACSSGASSGSCPTSSTSTSTTSSTPPSASGTCSTTTRRSSRRSSRRTSR